MKVEIPEYNKTLRPPEGVPHLTTHTGLRYWLVKYPPTCGRQSSVITEDSTISLHSYGGSRERGGTYLYCYKGFNTGVFCQRSNQGYFPWWDIRSKFDAQSHTTTHTISGIGTPVWDESLTVTEQEDGRRKVDVEARGRGVGYLTEITFDDYMQGKRTLFDSRSQQEEMINILPQLFAGLQMNLLRLEAGWENKSEALVVYDTQLKLELESGTLVST